MIITTVFNTCVTWVFNTLHSNGNLSGHVNHSIRCVHSCLDLDILITTSTKNPTWESMVLECLVTPTL